MNQGEAILSHLKAGKSLTPIEALNLYGCFRLAARIREFRKLGFDIKTERMKGNGKQWARYSMFETGAEHYKKQAEFAA